jgi:hypothetical protein
MIAISRLPSCQRAGQLPNVTSWTVSQRRRCLLRPFTLSPWPEPAIRLGPLSASTDLVLPGFRYQGVETPEIMY